eukprot:SAG22_NODE_16167_length_331_cov_1.112069_1_plen_110_part_11
MQEIFHVSRANGFHPTAIQVKQSLLSFFREVFVDTNSKQILRMLRQSKNGLWSVASSNGAGGNEPIAQCLLDELTPLAEPGFTLSGDRRAYLFEQVVLFFIQYACAVDPS